MDASRSGFAGFTKEAIQFLADLVEHNDRAWFQPRKPDYERLLKHLRGPGGRGTAQDRQPDP